MTPIPTTSISRHEKNGLSGNRRTKRNADLEELLQLDLCDICSRVNWRPILLDCCPDTRVEHEFPYRWADIPHVSSNGRATPMLLILQALLF